MSNRDSKDAWAGIVNLDETPHSSDPPVNDWEQSESITQDQTLVDTLPRGDTEPGRNFDLTKTDEFDLAQVTDSAPLEQPQEPRRPNLRRSPIQEKSPDLGAVFDADANDKIQQTPDASMSQGFAAQSPISDLEETPSKSWDPNVRPTWREYKKSIITGTIGLIFIATVTLVERNSSNGDDTTTRSNRTSANRKLERIERTRAGQLPSKREKIDEITRGEQPANQQAQDSSKQPSPPTANITNEDKQKVEKPILPMMSILSEPIGALVEINGKVYGKTPLIRQSPQSKGSLKVRLRYKYHQTLDATIWPNEDGHYEAKLILRKK